MVEVVATHVTRFRAPRALVAEVFPGVFVVHGGGVHSVLTAGNLFEPLPVVAPDRTFPAGEYAMGCARTYDHALRCKAAWKAYEDAPVDRRRDAWLEFHRVFEDRPD